MGLLNFLSQFLIYVFGLLYPSYHAFHYFYQIKKYPSLQDSGVVQELLHHFVVVSISIAFFWIGDLFFFWVPFYEEVKFFVIVWLVLPTTLGTLVLYERFVEPFLSQNKAQLDALFHSLESSFFNRVFDLMQIAFRIVKDVILFVAFKLLQTQPPTPPLPNRKDASPLPAPSVETASVYSNVWSFVSSLTSSFDRSYFQTSSSTSNRSSTSHTDYTDLPSPLKKRTSKKPRSKLQLDPIISPGN